MKNTIFKGLSSLILMGVALSVIGLGVAKAQVSLLKITDANGKEVIFYQESHALVIWAGDYQYWNKLNNIENEANDVVDALKRQGFQVKLVSNPKGQKLRDEIQAFINNHGYDQNNRLVIFFAGHGHTRKKTKGYLVPIDAPDPATNRQNEQDFLKVALDMDQVESWAKQVDAKHVLFVFDSCFSGTIFKQRSGKEKALYVQSVMNKPVRQFLTAGDENQRVPAESVFTPLFIRALEGAADYTKDGYVTGNEVGLYLKQNLSDYTKTQTPQFGTIRDPDLDQGDIVFRALNASQFVPTNPTVNPNPVKPNSNRSQPSPTPVTTPTPKPSPTQFFIISKVTGINYINLQKLLEQKKWKEADDITFKLMLKSAKHQNQDWTDRDWLSEQDINSFACEDLIIVDRLWSQYSNNQLGLSEQIKLWNDAVTNSTTITETYRQFAERVKWVSPSNSTSGSSYVSGNDIKYTNPPQGHFPLQITYPLGEGWLNGGSNTNRHLLYSHFADCLKKGN